MSSLRKSRQLDFMLEPAHTNVLQALDALGSAIAPVYTAAVGNATSRNASLQALQSSISL
jgi:hypothetical protein